MSDTLQDVLKKCENQSPARFRGLVEQSGLTQDEVGSLLGVSQGAVSQMIHGHSRIRSAYIYTLLDYVERKEEAGQ